MNDNHTIVEYFAEHERYRCGYCKSPNTNFSHGMWAHMMTCQDYQDLIDRGWRRSGKYCYKPTMNMTCCPMYPIKCKALDFQLSKSQKKVIKKVNRYLITGNKGDSDNKSNTNNGCERQTSSEHRGVEQIVLEKGKPSNNQPLTKLKETEKESAMQTDIEGASRLTGGTTISKDSTQGAQQSTGGRDKRAPKPGMGADPSRPACKKAKQIRLERHFSKKQITEESAKPIPEKKKSEAKTLEDFLTEPDHAQNCVHKLQIRLVPPSQPFTSSFDESHRVYEHYQMKIHGDAPGKANQKQYKRFLCDSPLVIRLYRSSMEVQPFLLSFQASYSVYQKYQMAIHNDPPEECNRMGFKEFLIDSPLEEEHKEDGPTAGYGSFHQQYLLDGKIIAVGVIDILPHCVSSVYLYYDPAYDFLNLGTYSALREISFVRELNKTAPSIANYYMGFYIHSCPKMRYKGQYTPSFLVCPETYSWVPLEKCRPLLDANRYSRLEEDGVEEKDKVDDLSQVLILFKNSIMPYEVYKTIKKNKNTDQNEVMEYASFVGRPCAERMLLLRSK